MTRDFFLLTSGSLNMDLSEDKRRSAVDALIGEMERGIAIIRSIDEDDFALGLDGESSIGAHIRHNLDFVNAVVNGIVVRRIDYNARVRDSRVECEPEYAIARMRDAVERLKDLEQHLLTSLVMVRSELDEDVWHASSVLREIEFLHSHTVHHYALVAKLMTARGHTTCKEFGVAPSTLRFRESVAAHAAG